jgi:fimbrial chaperone protein
MTPHARTVLESLTALGAFAALTAAASVESTTFSVDPLLIRLDAQTTNAVLTITNPTSKDISFEIKPFAWDQTPPDGAMQLTPTTDVVIFPPLAAVKAHSTQRIRVGTALRPGPVEKAYRIMIEELPGAAAPPGATQVNVRTRIGVPVFIGPTNSTVAGRIDSVSIAGRIVSIVLANTGTTHAMVDDVVIRGMSGPDQVVFEDSLQGWYVLAGKRRTWQYTFKPAQCRPAKFVEIEVYVNDKVMTGRADMPAGSCTQ